MSVGDNIEIRVVAANERVEALWLLFGWESEAQRRDRLAACVAADRKDPTRKTFQFLLEAVYAGDRLGCVWGHVVPGRIANVWPPSCLRNSVPDLCDLLQTTLDRELTAAGIVCGQSLLPPNAKHLSKILLRNGYRQAAQLLFLACDCANLPTDPPSSELQFVLFQQDQQQRLEKLVDVTYLGSLDAPILNGLRSTEDVIDGYRQTGNHSTNRWYFVRYQDRDVGCLLLTEHHPRQWELIYMGLVPDVRSRGWGEAITRYAQWLAGSAGCRTLLLGVDEENHPAITTYARCGFYELDRRLALIKQFQ
jgi:ribosomal protein S18 acetylase RimI-like enzyme